MSPPALELDGVSLTRSGRPILRHIDWTVAPEERWIVLGPNGSGKTTLARVATLWEHPSAGSVSVLGQELGRTDVRTLRSHVGFVSSAMADLVRADIAALDVVMCGIHGALEPWWHSYGPADREAAMDRLRAGGLEAMADRSFGTLSSGERQRVLLARAYVADPSLVVLDEPNAGLDLGGREELIDDLERRASHDGAPAIVLVTHHVEEIPPSFTHLLALNDGHVVSAGAIAEVLTEDLLAECFGVRVMLETHRGEAGVRYSARRR
ncbi:MAG: ABC transporter ATP-binding protein [Microthrixaceae bacterium]